MLASSPCAIWPTPWRRTLTLPITSCSTGLISWHRNQHAHPLWRPRPLRLNRRHRPLLHRTLLTSLCLLKSCHRADEPHSSQRLRPR
ncbi:hypothetical protein BJX70DRAFT_384435 [Aspergillus crustosus]